MSRMYAAATRVARRLLTITSRRAAAYLAVVFAIDALLALAAPPLVLLGLLDEVAHLLTAALLLAALRPRVPAQVVLAALAASMLIDVDHLPQYAGEDVLTEGLPRPVTHSIATLVVLGVLAATAWGLPWQLATGALLGVSTHFVRDLATGPGLALLWPLSDQAVRVSYTVYAALVVAAAVIAERRSRHRRSREI